MSGIAGAALAAALSVALGLGPVPAAEASTPLSARAEVAAPAATTARATLTVRIADLPAKVAASVRITGPHGYRRTLPSGAVLGKLLPGRYSVAAGQVRDSHGTLYLPTSGTGTFTLAAGGRATRTVDYYTRVPASTRAVAAATITKVTTAANGRLTVTVHDRTRYAVGQVLAAGVGPRTPNGLLAKVVAVRAVTGGEVVTAAPATLRQAFPQGTLTFTRAYPAQAAPAVAPAATAPGWSKNLKCGASAQVALQGTLSSSLSGTLHADWSLLGGTSASVSATVHEASSLTATLNGAAACTLTTTQLGSTRTLGEFTVFIGPIPVVVVPRLSFFVRGSVKTTGSVTASAGQDFTATAGLSYAHGKLTPNATAVASSTHQPPTVTGTGRLTVAVSTRLRLDLFGVAGPTVNIDPGLDLAADVTANPWWTLTGTLDAGATLRIPALGINASNPRLMSRRVELAHAAGPFPATAVADVAAGGNGTDGPVLGPDGRVWLVAWDAARQHTLFEAVDPATQAVQTYHQTAAGTVGTLSYSGPLAFDGGGGLWLVGYSLGGNPSGPVLIRYTPTGAVFSTYAVPADCLTPPSGLASSSDGYVWASCVGYAGDTVVTRIFGGGTFTTYHAPSGAATLGPLVPGANGVMWALGRGSSHTSVVEIGTDGQAAVFHDDGSNAGGLFLSGNGTGAVVETAQCDDGTGTGTLCFQQVGTDGTRTPLGGLPGTDGATGGRMVAPAMDRSGNLEVLVEPGASSVVEPGQYYFYELTPSGKGTVHAFTMPTAGQGQTLVPVADGIPVVTADGALWLEQSQWPVSGDLLRVAVPATQ